MAEWLPQRGWVGGDPLGLLMISSFRTCLQDAADMIMHFLLVRLEAGRKEAAAAAMRATAAQARAAKSRAELMRGIRLAMMVRLWG